MCVCVCLCVCECVCVCARAPKIGSVAGCHNELEGLSGRRNSYILVPSSNSYILGPPRERCSLDLGFRV